MKNYFTAIYDYTKPFPFRQGFFTDFCAELARENEKRRAEKKCPACSYCNIVIIYSMRFCRSSDKYSGNPKAWCGCLSRGR